MNKKNQIYNKLLEDEAKVLERYQCGESCETISKDYNCHPHSIRKFLIKKGVERRPAGGFHKAKKEGMKNGYKIIPTSRDYPKKFNNGGLMYYEHILKLENRLGRYLESHEVGHHIDLDKLNNGDKNLVACTTQEHAQLHNQLNEIVSELIKRKIITFDEQTRKYDSTWIRD